MNFQIMDTLRTEVLCDILSRCSEYAPVLKETYHKWNEILSNAVANRAVLSFEKMAERGHLDLLKYIGNDKINAKRILNILLYAAKEGHLNIMILMKKWGADDYNGALVKAAKNGQILAMYLSKQWGAINYDHALIKAASRGHISAMRSLKRWGATEYDWALAVAVKNEQIPAMHLLKEWGAKACDNTLIYKSCQKTG